MKIGQILCKIGLHAWGKPYGFDQNSSNIIDWKKKCTRCGKIHKWVEHKEEPYY